MADEFYKGEPSGLQAENAGDKPESVPDNLARETIPAPGTSGLKVVEGAKTINKGTEETRKMKENYRFFGPATFAYALFYAFCMYKNGSGITFPFFVASSLLYFCYSLKKLGLTLKKDSVFYGVIMMLLAVATFCTDDARLIWFNKTGIFLLMISFLLKQFYNTRKWGFGKYLGAIPAVVITALSQLPRPVTDGMDYAKSHQNKDRKKLTYFLAGLVLAIPILLIVTSLLGSADAVFRQMTKGIVEALHFDNAFAVIVRIVFWFFATYMLVANLCDKMIKEEVKDRRRGEPIIAITVTGMLSLLYLFFSWIQIFYLFLGKMQLPEGYTYAAYAREGFFQLLAVSILNLVIVLLCMTFFRESKALRAILTVMSLCTFIMIASSALRMTIYIRYYYLTFLRILVLWALAVLTLLFIGVLIQIYRKEFGLFRYGVAVVSILYLALSFSHPDYVIARVNLANAPDTMEEAINYWYGGKQSAERGEGEFFQNGKPYQDYRYLANLSADAAPVLVPYLRQLGYDVQGVMNEKINQPSDIGKGKPEGFGYVYLEKMKKEGDGLGIRTFNLSRYLALKEMEKGSN